jgi:HSP20 family protein
MYKARGSMTNELATKANDNESATDLDRVFDELGRQFDETFGLRPWGTFWTLGVPPNVPTLRAARTDVTDTGKAFKVVAEMPGLPKDAIEIHVKGTSVEIRGEVTQAKNEGTPEAYVHRERTHVGYYRALELPEPVLAQDAKATVVNGVLELELPKQHPTVPETDVKVPVQ